MTPDMRFDGRVALVTGGAGGLGRSHCLELARRGAKVVVNGRRDARLAPEAVRDEIISAGGEAIAVRGTVGDDADAKALVQATIDSYGRIDILINNAGTAGNTVSVENAPTDSFYREIAVHLAGALQLNRAAWPHMASRNYGRIVFTGSAMAFGFYEGPAGYEVDYTAAKSALFGVMRQTAGAGAKLGIKANMVMPFAHTPMVARTLGESEFAQWMAANLRPEQVTAGMIYLAHEDCPTSGDSFSLAGGRMARVVFASPAGFFDPDLSAEQVRANWSTICGDVGPELMLANMHEIRGQPDEYLMICKALGV